MSIVVGFGLLFAIAVGYLIHYLHVPKVTGYVILGIIMGPFGLGLITPEDIGHLYLISELALGLIVFSIGGELNAAHFRKIGGRILIVSLAEVALTVVVITGIILCLGKSFSFAFLLGIIGIATAPAATLLVLREFDSEGPVTHYILILVGMNNLFCLALFRVVFQLEKMTGGGSPAAALIKNLMWSLGEIGGSLLMGLLLGLLVVVGERYLRKKNELLTLILAMIVIGVGCGSFFGLSSLLINLALGCAVANLSREYTSLLGQVKSIDLPLYIIFFILAGASLELDLIPSAGAIGIAYLGGRTVGKLVGMYVGARHGKAPETVCRFAGWGMLAQAGIAIGLCQIIAKEDPVFGPLINSTVLSSVVIFELLGPISLRWALIKAGEVKLINIIHKKESFPFWESIMSRTKQLFGLPPRRISIHDGPVLVKHVMRTQIETIQEDTPFDQILKFIEHSRYNQFPVVDREGIFVGLIAYQEIRDSLYDESIRHLIIAKDLATPPKVSVSTEMTLEHGLQQFSFKDVDFIPVVNADEPSKLVGILTQRDALAAFRIKK
ncbi:MAG: cation:proton antiporter [Deltaproteobacteria bacterium]|nr:cation:proton antiporter [Deltaproteobacteria bacterium]